MAKRKKNRKCRHRDQIEPGEICPFITPEGCSERQRMLPDCEEMFLVNRDGEKEQGACEEEYYINFS